MRGLGVAFAVLVGITVVSDVLVTAWVWRLRDVLDDYLHDLVGEAELNGELAASAALGILNTALYVATGVVFVVWLWRVRLNADLIAPHASPYRRSWVIWGWLPIVSLWIPRRLVADAWDVSRTRHESAGGHGLVNLWWGLFLGYQVLDRVADRLLARSETVDGLGTGAQVLTLATALSVPAAVVAVLVVRRIGEWQSTPGFVTPDEVVSPMAAGLSPVDWPGAALPSNPVIAPPRHDPRWRRPD
ncbi:DUF4328 domain-containing protein [Saccharothrix hoggarensis]|uniref:DUF4328 domain-containing protein n=1 Tax=Saccharothrix hoggarensis TaxID=913853 RepID=A0ABW3R3V7_9PSEU